MNLSELTHRFCFRQIDEDAIMQFLMTQQEELLLDDKTAVQKVVDRLFDYGGILATFTPDGEIVAMLGFFFGDPSHHFEDKDTLFLYVAAIAKQYRLSRLFYQGMLFVMRKGRELGMINFRMQANIHDPYSNKLYSRMGKPLGESRTMRGHRVMTYGGVIQDLLARYERTQKRVEHSSKTQYAKNNVQHTLFLAPAFIP
ncbi:MAG: hypothetical protein AAF490_22880 [Chloroflexota bacterium]